MTIGLRYLKEELNYIRVPKSHEDLRKQLVEELLENHGEYSLQLNRDKRRILKCMKQVGQLPWEEVMLAACKIYGIEIFVHHGMQSPVVYRYKECKHESGARVHLQCISGIHYNPVYSRQKEEVLVATLIDKHINEIKLYDCKKEIEGDIEIDEVHALVRLHALCKYCTHNIQADMGCVVAIGDTKWCGLIDSGAQVSLMAERVYKELLKNLHDVVLEECLHRKVNGINGELSEILGCVEIRVVLINVTMKPVIFAIVKDEVMPSCLILGANFLSDNNLLIDCSNKWLIFKDEINDVRYPLGLGGMKESIEFKYDVTTFLGLVQLSSEKRVILSIDRDCIVEMQEADNAIDTLKGKVCTMEKPRHWKERYLQRFKRYFHQFVVENDILWICKNSVRIPIISFSFLVNVTVKIHNKLTHIGKHKLGDIVHKHFWHPATNEVVKDVTLTCSHCQFNKTFSQAVKPPTLKIQAKFPFDLIALDLLQFSRSSIGNIALLVMVDHCSKFVVAIPIRDKTTHTVTKTLLQVILPQLVRVPCRVLTDNGPEFRSCEFNEALERYSIDHVYSTQYRAAGNGAVERVNRTVTQLLKSLVNDSQTDWDVTLHHALITYNTTLHSQLSMSPADFIMCKAHECDHNLPVAAEVVKT